MFDPIADDIVKSSRAITGGQGPKVVFDCAGVAQSLKTATLAARAKGLIINIALFSKEVPFHPNNLSIGEKTYQAGETSPFAALTSTDMSSDGVSARGFQRSHFRIGVRSDKAGGHDHQKNKYRPRRRGWVSRPC